MSPSRRFKLARFSPWIALARIALALLFAQAPACGPSAEATEGETEHDAGADADLAEQALLIDHRSWQRYDRALDPLIGEQPAEISCGVAGFFVERGELEIDSNRCNYVLAVHPALRDVRRGQRLALEFRHFDLEAPEPAQAHVAILFRDQLAWELRIDIPGLANVIRAEFTATTDLAAGEPIRLHLHNHGQNTYTLASLQVLE